MLASRALIRQSLRDSVWKAYRGDAVLGPDDLNIGPHSVDVSLGGKFMIQRQYRTDMGQGDKIHVRDMQIDPYKTLDCQGFEYKEFEAEKVTLQPGDFLLGFARERFDCKAPVPVEVGHGRDCGPVTTNFAFTQIYDGRSTMGRLGVMSHVTAGYGDYGFDGNFTLELANVGNAAVVLHAGMRIGQVSFHGILGSILGAPAMYAGAYQHHINRPFAPVTGRDRFVSPGDPLH